jgi:hypothetical protein
MALNISSSPVELVVSSLPSQPWFVADGFLAVRAVSSICLPATHHCLSISSPADNDAAYLKDLSIASTLSHAPWRIYRGCAPLNVTIGVAAGGLRCKIQNINNFPLIAGLWVACGWILEDIFNQESNCCISTRLGKQLHCRFGWTPFRLSSFADQDLGALNRSNRRMDPSTVLFLAVRQGFTYHLVMGHLFSTHPTLRCLFSNGGKRSQELEYCRQFHAQNFET